MTVQRNQASTGNTIILQPGEGRMLPGPEGITLKATADETGGSLGFFEATTEAGFGAPRHIHHNHDELFYVLAGELRFLIGEQIVDAPAGSFVFIPRGTVHAPKIIGTEPARVLSAFIPGGPEQAFEEFARLEPGPDGGPDLEQMQTISARYDSEIVGPPL